MSTDERRAMNNEDDDLLHEDVDVFRAAMKGVRPLKKPAQIVRKTPPRPLANQLRRDDDAVRGEMLDGELDFSDIEYGDEVNFQRPSVSRVIMRKLRRGQFAVQAEFDLHGLAVADAKSDLADFIRHSSARGLTCVRVIHGKGHRSPGKLPVLKPKVAGWLSRTDVVLAFTSARPVDGGTGALYVLLRGR